MLPVIIFLFIFSYIPMYGIVVAFQDYTMGKRFLAFDGSVNWVGFKHFIQFFKSIYFGRIFSNTLILSFSSIICGFWVPIVFALILNEIKHTVYKRVVQTLSYLPHFISTVIIVGIIMSLFSASDGMVNKVLELMGGQRINFFNRPEYFRPIYVISGIWQSFGWGTILYMASISSIDPALYDSAKIDGANRLRQAVHITIPGIKATIAVLLILSLGSVLHADTEKVLLMYNPAIYRTADVIGTFVYRSGLMDFRYSYAAAVGLFTTVVNFIILSVTNIISKKTTNYGLW